MNLEIATKLLEVYSGQPLGEEIPQIWYAGSPIGSLLNVVARAMGTDGSTLEQDLKKSLSHPKKQLIIDLLNAYSPSQFFWKEGELEPTFWTQTLADNQHTLLNLVATITGETQSDIRNILNIKTIAIRESLPEEQFNQLYNSAKEFIKKHGRIASADIERLAEELNIEYFSNKIGNKAFNRRQRIIKRLIREGVAKQIGGRAKGQFVGNVYYELIQEQPPFITEDTTILPVEEIVGLEPIQNQLEESSVSQAVEAVEAAEKGFVSYEKLTIDEASRAPDGFSSKLNEFLIVGRYDYIKGQYKKLRFASAITEIPLAGSFDIFRDVSTIFSDPFIRFNLHKSLQDIKNSNDQSILISDQCHIQIVPYQKKLFVAIEIKYPKQVGFSNFIPQVYAQELERIGEIDGSELISREVGGSNMVILDSDRIPGPATEYLTLGFSISDKESTKYVLNRIYPGPFVGFFHTGEGGISPFYNDEDGEPINFILLPEDRLVPGDIVSYWDRIFEKVQEREAKASRRELEKEEAEQFQLVADFTEIINDYLNEVQGATLDEIIAHLQDYGYSSEQTEPGLQNPPKSISGLERGPYFPQN